MWTGFIILQKARGEVAQAGALVVSYKIDYTEPGGRADTLTVRYNAAREKFFETLDRLIKGF